MVGGTDRATRGTDRATGGTDRATRGTDSKEMLMTINGRNNPIPYETVAFFR